MDTVKSQVHKCMMVKLTLTAGVLVSVPEIDNLWLNSGFS